MLNWFRTRKNMVKLLESQKIIIDKQSSYIEVLLEAFTNSQTTFQNYKVDVNTLVGAITLQNNGELIINKDFFDAIINSDSNFVLQKENLEDGSIKLSLTQASTEEKKEN